MTTYRAIVSITFDDEDLAELAGIFGVEPDRMDPQASLDGALDNLELGSGWVEQFFCDGEPAIFRASGGMMVEVNEHDL